jgi:hypothetical protein
MTEQVSPLRQRMIDDMTIRKIIESFDGMPSRTYRWQRF